MAKSFSEITEEIRKLNEQLQRLGKGGYKSSQLEDIFKSMNQDLDSAKTLFDDLNDRVDRIAYSFDNISGSLRDALKDLKGQVEATKQIQQSYSKLTSIADKLRDHQKNEYILSVKKLKILKEQAQQEVNELKRARQVLEQKKKSTGLTEKEKEYYREINQALNLKNSYLNQTVKQLEKEIKLEERRADVLGITQGMFKGIHGLMKKIGVESGAFDRINESMREASARGGVFKTAMAGLKATTTELKESFTSIPGSLTVITQSFKYLWDIAAGYSNQIQEIQQGLGGTWEQSSGIRDNFKEIAESNTKIFSTQKDLIAATLSLNQAAGTFNAYSVDALDNFTKLTQVAGLTADQANKLQQYGDMYNKTSENIYDTIGKTKKGLLNNKQVLTQVLNVNGQLAAQYKNSPDLLAKAVVQANKLGMTLEQSKKAASGLLDFESSISSELEAELLTGKNLNFEQARYLALMGDSAGAAAEMMKQVGGIEEFNKMNVIQQDALAKSMGMTSDELADSLVKQKQLEELDKKRVGQSKELQKQVKALRDQGKMAEADALEKMALEEGDVTLAKQKLSTQKEYEKSMEKMKELFVNSIAPIITSLTEKVTGFITWVSNNPVAKTLIKAAGAAFAIGTVIAAVAGIGNIISKAFGGGGILGMFAKRGSRLNPMFVQNVGGGGGGGLGDVADMLKGGRKGGFGGGFKGFTSYAKDMFKGGKAGTVARARMMRGVGDIFSGGTGTFVGGTDKAVTAASKGTGMLGKAGSVLAKGAKVLGPLGALADIGIGAYSGAQAGSMSKEEQKAAGIRQGMGSVAGGTFGALTGGAEKGSMLSEYVGIEKGSGVDEAMGVAGSAGRGALAGAAIGSVVPVVGTAIGAAVGAIVGAGAESVKLLSDPDSQFRKTISGWGESISEFASSSGETLKGWGSSMGETFSGIFSGIGSMASSAWNGLKSIGGGIMDAASSGLSSVGSAISSGVSTVGDWLGFAEGGIVQSPTKALIGEAGQNEAVVPLDQFYAKLDQLITAVNNISSGGGDVFLDGQKVGKVINMSARGIQ